MIVDYTFYNDFGHATVRPYTIEIEQWLMTNVTNGKWWIASKQHSQSFICIENKKDFDWFVLRWS
jgi:hypothetical protein